MNINLKDKISFFIISIFFCSTAFANEKIVNVIHCGTNLQKHLDAGCKIITSNQYDDTQKFILSCPDGYAKNFVMYHDWEDRDFCIGYDTCSCRDSVMTKEEAKDIDKKYITAYGTSY